MGKHKFASCVCGNNKRYISIEYNIFTNKYTYTFICTECKLYASGKSESTAKQEWNRKIKRIRESSKDINRNDTNYFYYI